MSGVDITEKAKDIHSIMRLASQTKSNYKLEWEDLPYSYQEKIKDFARCYFEDHSKSNQYLNLTG